jgi:two-component sensor histidine kinase
MTPNRAITLGLMLHELATNAAKHGALRGPNGHVSVEWTVSSETGRDTVHLVWLESGGPPVVAPGRDGFGTRLLETGAGQLGGRIEKRWATEGLVCRLTFPVPSSTLPPASHQQTP